jgi:ABC-type oligopeptide transport system substrate-binding subunit
MRILKAIMIVTVLASALTLSACAEKKETMSTGTTTASSVRTYSK